MKARAARDARRLEIRARRDVSTALVGAYRSAFRGHGLTFDELREYRAGEDAAQIEWKATARLGHPVVKQMREERDLLLALLVDVSMSLEPGFGGRARGNAARRVAAALAAAAFRASDRIALVTFASSIAESLAPAAGRMHLDRVFRAIETPPRPGPTRPGPALDWAADTLPRHAVVVVVSDLLFPDPGRSLARCARKHDLILLRISDPIDELPRRSAPVRVAPVEPGRPGLWRPRRHRPRLHLDEATARGRGADYGVLGSGAELIPSLRRFFEARRGIAG